MEHSKFILEVQLRPCLWNPGVESFWDRVLKRQIWEEVAAKMYKHYNNFSDDEKRAAVVELRRKWKSLTDFYKRRNPKLDIDEKTQRKKPIVELLHFLDNVSTFKREKRPRTRTRKKTIKIKNPEEIFQIPNYKETFKIKKHQAKSSSEFQQRECSQSENSNIKFLQSLLPDLQSLDDRQRFEFKLGVMNLIKKIKYDLEVPNISISEDLLQQDFILSDQQSTLIIQTPLAENSPLSLSPIDFSFTSHDEQLMLRDIGPELQLVSPPDLDLSKGNVHCGNIGDCSD